MSETCRRCRITIDTYECNGCESCVSLMPELFRMSEATGKAETVGDIAPCSTNLDRTAAVCPQSCIAVERL